MQRTVLSLILFSGVTFVRCLTPEDNHQQRSCLLQVQQSTEIKPGDSLALLEQKHGRSKFTPTHGNGGNLPARTDGSCSGTGYQPSELEQGFNAHAVEWTKDDDALCDHLKDSTNKWIQENVEAKYKSGNKIFSHLCKEGDAPQLLEPLAGILRDPRVICEPFDENFFFGIDWLVLADNNNLNPEGGKNILYDAGGTRFMDAMHFFTSQYERRGIELDEIYVWEANRQGTENYWNDTAPEVRQKWEPKLTFYDGVPVSADENDNNNPITRILKDCLPEDFCAFKLDIDTPSVELPIISQILSSIEVAARIDEFFFEHHVTGLMENWGWDKDVNGTFADSYSMFTRLRQMGVRAHSWI